MKTCIYLLYILKHTQNIYLISYVFQLHDFYIDSKYYTNRMLAYLHCVIHLCYVENVADKNEDKVFQTNFLPAKYFLLYFSSLASCRLFPFFCSFLNIGHEVNCPLLCQERLGKTMLSQFQICNWVNLVNVDCKCYPLFSIIWLTYDCIKSYCNYSFMLVIRCLEFYEVRHDMFAFLYLVFMI